MPRLLCFSGLKDRINLDSEHALLITGDVVGVGEAVENAEYILGQPDDSSIIYTSMVATRKPLE